MSSGDDEDMEDDCLILDRVEQNDSTLTVLQIGGGPSSNEEEIFDSTRPIQREFYDQSAYSRLGECIAGNTHLKILYVNMTGGYKLTSADRGFYNGLIRNSSIKELTINFNRLRPFVGGEIHAIFNAYQANSSHLTKIQLSNVGMQHQDGGDHIINTTFGCCTNLQEISINNCNLADEHLLPMVETIRGHRMLNCLNLTSNMIGNEGCEVLATLLNDPNSNLQSVYLYNNQIKSAGAITLANSLTSNTKLDTLFLAENPIDSNSIQDAFCNLLCNASSINETYASNHTLNAICRLWGGPLQPLLQLNTGSNKSHVAIKKILHCHPSMNMEPLYEWDAKGEQTLKALPYVIDWFKRAEEVLAGGTIISTAINSTNEDHSIVSDDYKDDCSASIESEDDADNEDTYVLDGEDTNNSSVDSDGDDDANSDLGDGDSSGEEEKSHQDRVVSDNEDTAGMYNISVRKLSAIFQFSLAMPLLFEGIARFDTNDIGSTDNKRKRK